MLATGIALLAFGLILLISQLSLTGFVTNVPLDINVSAKATLCAFFLKYPAYVAQNSTVLFRVGVRNCGTVPVNGSSTYYVFDPNSVNIFETQAGTFSLGVNQETNFSVLFDASVTSGKYTAVIASNASNGSLTDYLEVRVDFYVIPPIQEIIVLIAVPTGSSGGGGGGGGGPSLAQSTNKTEQIVRLNVSFPMEVLNATHNSYLIIGASVQNLGPQKVGNISLVPLLDSNWNFTTAQIDFLGPKETLKRTLGIMPLETADERIYVLPVSVLVAKALFQVVYIVVNVRSLTPAFSRLSILEYPYRIEIAQEGERDLSYLVKNTGTLPLSNISTRLENFEGCLSSVRYGRNKAYLEVNGTAILDLSMKANATQAGCNVTLISYSGNETSEIKVFEIFVKEKGELTETVVSGTYNLLAYLLELMSEAMADMLNFLSDLFSYEIPLSPD